MQSASRMQTILRIEEEEEEKQEQEKKRRNNQNRNKSVQNNSITVLNSMGVDNNTNKRQHLMC